MPLGSSTFFIRSRRTLSKALMCSSSALRVAFDMSSEAFSFALLREANAPERLVVLFRVFLATTAKRAEYSFHTASSISISLREVATFICIILCCIWIQCSMVLMLVSGQRSDGMPFTIVCKFSEHAPMSVFIGSPVTSSLCCSVVMCPSLISCVVFGGYTSPNFNLPL